MKINITKLVAFFLIWANKAIASMCGSVRKDVILAECSSNISPIISKESPNAPPILFAGSSVRSVWHIRNLLKKEPETIEWVNSFRAGEVFWDVGANIGLYGIYAGMRQCKVCVFEPQPSNYHTLAQNIALNCLEGVVESFNLAFQKETCLMKIYMSTREAGNTLLDGAEKNNPNQGYTVIGYSMDDFIKKFQLPTPNHIKIDVDGAEYQILLGANDMLKDASVNSLLIEINNHREMIADYLKTFGFSLTREPQLGDRMRKGKKYVGVNYIFQRQ